MGWGWSWTLPHTWGPCVSSQVIGTLPWVVNSASVAAPAPAQSLQVQAVTPQLLLNAQGQVIATLASSPLPPPVAVRKPSTPESPAKSDVQGLGWGRVAGSAVRHERPPSRGWVGQHYFPKSLGKQDTSPKWSEVQGRRSLQFTCALPGKTPPPPRPRPPAHQTCVYVPSEARATLRRPGKGSQSKLGLGTSLVVQCLRLCTSNSGDAGLILGRRTKIPHAAG